MVVTVRFRQQELQQIEEAVQCQPGIAAAAAVEWPLPERSSHVRCYYIAVPGAGLSNAELRRRLLHTLPLRLLPASFFAVEQFPGAIGASSAQEGLPRPARRPALPMPYLAPTTRVERVMADIWAEVLDVDLVGVHDSFLDLGGDSLQAARVVAQMRHVLEADLPASRLLEATTVAIMAELVEHQMLELAPRRELEALLAQIEALSDEQARRMLDSQALLACPGK